MTHALRADLNDFLFSPIADDPNGMHLTMLSALARSGVDPWDEAAALRALSQDAAAARLVHLLGTVPNGPSPGDDTTTVVARLIALLHASPKSPQRQTTPTAATRGEDTPLKSFAMLSGNIKLALYSLAALFFIIMGYRTLFSGD